MVKVQLVGCTAQRTLSFVTDPNFKLNFGWNNAATLSVKTDWPFKILFAFNRD
jgi:hypothetical protein